ncbi:MAG: hypothetical protein ACP5XB_11090 [Isosphaeraceae bacterium]
MLKPLTLSLSLAVALGLSSVSMAGSNDGCTTCGLASPQGGPIATAQAPCGPTCETGCAKPRHSLLCGLGNRLNGMRGRLKCALHPPVTYEWVLKKKRLWGHGGCNGGAGSCDTCGAGGVYPTGQVVPSGQGAYAAPQGAPVFGAGQHAFNTMSPSPTIASVPAEMSPAVAGEEAPPAPEVNQSGLLLPTPSGN